MTKNDVLQIEKSLPADSSDEEVVSKFSMFNLGHSTEKYSDYLYYTDVTLAGYKDTWMSYGFDDDKLKDITYIFNTGDAQKVYTEMRSNLSNKYESPIFDENAPFPSESRRVLSKDDNIDGVDVECSISQYSGWLVKYADCYVEIDLCLHKIKIGTNTIYASTIGYKLVSFQEVEDLRELVQQYTQSVQTSIENDL